MPVGEIDLLAAPKSPGAHHQKAKQGNQQHPRNGQPPVEDGLSVEQVNYGSDNPGRRRYGHAHEIFAVRLAGILGQRIVADVESRQASRSAQQKQETKKRAKFNQFLAKRWIHRDGQHGESPGKRQDAGGDAEGDDVRERIQFFTELAGGVRHASDTAIQGVEGYREADGERSVVEVMGLQRGPLQTLGDGEVSCGNVA